LEAGLSEDEKKESLIREMNDNWISNSGIFKKVRQSFFNADYSPNEARLDAEPRSGMYEFEASLSSEADFSRQLHGMSYAQSLKYTYDAISKADIVPNKFSLKKDVKVKVYRAECMDLDSIDVAIKETLKQIDGNQALRKLSLETKKLAYETEKKINDKRTDANGDEIRLIAKQAHVGMSISIKYINMYLQQHTLLLKFMSYYIAHSIRAFA
jgi:phosphate uptake regulator